MEQYQEEKRSNNTALKAALVLMTALAGLFAYLYFNTSQVVEQKEVTIAATTRDLIIAKGKLDSLSVQLDAQIAEVTAMGGQVADLQAIKSRLEAEKKKILADANSKRTFDLKGFQERIKGYEDAITEKDKELVQLRDENRVLTGRNNLLNQENTSLRTEKSALDDTVSTYVQKTKDLTEKVNYAAVPRAERIVTAAISSRGRERDGAEFKAKRVDKIKVGFLLPANILAKREPKDIFLRVTDPSGAVISDMATGSGAFMFNGRETVYTAKQRVAYDNENGSTGEFIYQRGMPYEKGKYGIELYCQGLRIGNGSFEVK